MEVLMTTVERWAVRCGLDEFQTATAQSLAWLYRERHLAAGGVDYPPGWWARLAVRQTRNGRDLPHGDCTTPPGDALNHAHQGSGMGEMMDRSPPPDALAAHKEQWERMEADLSVPQQTFLAMRLEGWKGFEIAAALGLSQGRISQIARRLWENFHGGE